MRPEPGAIAGSARWHLFDIDPDAASAELIRLDEADYRQASFLDQRVLPAAREQHRLPLEQLGAALDGGPAVAAPHFIFHIGHCGSTLLSRALDASLQTLPLREPLTLRRLAALDAPERDRLLPVTLQAHERVFRPGQAAVIKATSTCNALIGPVLGQRPTSRAVLMYVDLETCLAGMLGKQAPALDLRGHLPARLADWSRLDGAPSLDAGRLGEAELAALAWLTGMRHLVAAAGALGERVRLVDFEAFLSQPEDGLVEVATFLGLESDADRLLDAWPEVSSAYSKKPDEPYSAFNRRNTLRRGRTTRATEIRAGLAWARAQTSRTQALAGCEKFFGATG